MSKIIGLGIEVWIQPWTNDGASSSDSFSGSLDGIRNGGKFS